MEEKKDTSSVLSLSFNFSFYSVKHVYFLCTHILPFIRGEIVLFIANSHILLLLFST